MLFKGKKGVSPVIGVILMVAITVILAAVIASFVFGMGSKVKPVPQAQIMLSDSGDEDNIKVEHYGGDALNLNVTSIYVYDQNGNEVCSNTSLSGIFKVGDVKYIDSNCNWLDEPNSTGNFSAGTYTVRFVDTEAGVVIFEGKVTIS